MSSPALSHSQPQAEKKELRQRSLMGDAARRYRAESTRDGWL